jgi:hypothetical protein
MTEDRLNMRLDADRSLAPADEPRRHTTTSTADLKRAVCAAVDAMRAELIGVSRAIHAAPELSFQEEKAAALLTESTYRND